MKRFVFVVVCAAAPSLAQVVGEVDGPSGKFTTRDGVGNGNNHLLISDVKKGKLKSTEHGNPLPVQSCSKLLDAGAPIECYDLVKDKVSQGLQYELADGGLVTVAADGGNSPPDDGATIDDVQKALDQLAVDNQMQAPSKKGYYQENAVPGRADRAMVVVDPDGNPLRELPPIDEDDVVLVVVVPPADKPVVDMAISKCGTAPTARVLGDLTELNRVSIEHRQAGLAFRVATACSADDGIEVTLKLKNETNAKTFTLKTLPLYRFTVALGFMYDFTHVTDYRADSVKGEAVPVIVENRRAAALGAAAFVTLRTYKADTRRSRFRSATGVWQMLLNFSIGISLSDPLDHLYTAINIEPYPGIGLLVGWHFFAQKHLGGGYAVGDRFAGGTAVPVDKRWTAWSGSPNLFLGVTLDSSILSALLGALNR